MWQKDKQSGYGVFYVGREHFEGQFSADEMHGFCKFQRCKESRDYQLLEGTWNQGTAYGKNVAILKGGEVIMFSLSRRGTGNKL